MILNTLHLENYKQYARLDLEFREGLVGVVGRNGAGKSTIFEAILYCLFGRDESDKALIRSAFAEPKATVVLALSFTLGLERYQVKREFRGKILTTGAELFKNDELIAKGVSAVNDEIARLLNMERDAFKRSVFSGQKELAELSEASGGERQRMVRKMLGLDNLDDIKKRVNEDIRSLRQQISGQAQLLLDTEAVQVLEQEIAAENTRWDALGEQLAAENEKLTAVAARYREADAQFKAEEARQRDFNERRRELDRRLERRENLNVQRTEWETRLTELQQRQAGLDARRTEFSGHAAEKKQLAQLEEARQRQINYAANAKLLAEAREEMTALESRLAEPEKQIATRPAVQADRTEQEALLEKTSAEIKAHLEQFKLIDNKISVLRERIHDREAKIARLAAIGKDGECPTCFQPVQDAYDRVVSQLNDEIAAIQSEELAVLEREQEMVRQHGLELRKQEVALREKIETLRCEEIRLDEIVRQLRHDHTQQQKLEAQIVQYQLVLQKIGTVEFDEADYQSRKNRFESREPEYLEFLKAEAHIGHELPASQAALARNAAEAAQLERDITAQTAALEQTGYNPAAYETAYAALSGFQEAYSAQSAAANALERQRQELQNEIARRREKIQANSRIRALIGDKQLETELLDRLALSLDGFRNEILEKVSPSISREASALFSRITKGKYESILVDENFDFKIADGGEYYPIKRFSGGEIDLANFCLRIAITKAIVELSGSGQGIEFLAFDEIFGSQDEERRLEILLALNFLQEQFRQIYIVSHIESLRDYFPNILEIKSTPEGGSTARWV